ncbi:MAG: aspartate/glutamate racemase family protein [Bosea sp.]|nr:aspartate/glutamate racemase family protein [Bosea sp. (in: a-proteobacteria)]
MTAYSVRTKSQSWYGQPIGILILDAAYPCVPGNVGNATTYDFPVCYQEVRGASIERLLTQRDPALAEPFVEAARELERRGVRAITGACGFMALFQRQVAGAVEIPVFLSSLMQVPFIHAATGKPVGIITANASLLRAEHFDLLGISPSIPKSIAGMETQPEFRSAILEEKGTLDSAAIEAEVVAVARDLIGQAPETGAILLECSDLPPYARAVQEAVDRPVFDFNTMINYMHGAIVRRRYSGHL